jgi:hypothetical protein
MQRTEGVAVIRSLDARGPGKFVHGIGEHA